MANVFFFGVQMIQAKLFLGFPIDEIYLRKVAGENPQLAAMVIDNGPNYLTKISYKNKRYLGKYVGEIADIHSLELLELNIYSLLRKIVPEDPYKEPLQLLPIGDFDSYE